MSFGKAFINQINFFSNDFNVYAPDLKGFGENKEMPYPYALSDYVRELKEYINENGIKKPFVIAHSFGGRVAIKALSETPNLFSKLVLVSSAGLKPKTTIKKRFKKFLFNFLKKFIKKEKLKCFYSSDYLALNPIMKESFKLIINEHLDGALDKINIPTLVVCGDKDKETPPYMAKKFNENIKNSKLLMLGGAGHFCFLDKPHKFNMEVKEFLLE